MNKDQVKGVFEEAAGKKIGEVMGSSRATGQGSGEVSRR